MNEDYYIKRTNEIINEPYLIPMLYMIGKEHNINITDVHKDMKKKYFKQLVIDYLKDET